MKHTEWMRHASTEYDLLDQLLTSLAPSEWELPTVCPDWTVRRMVAHLVGAAEATASVREQMRQQRIAGRTKGDRVQLDVVNELQVAERADRAPGQLVDDLRDAGGRGIRARTKLPAPIRALRFTFPPPVGRVSLGYLMDTVYTRDAWMHRMDIAEVTGRTLAPTREHDGALVADAAAEWIRQVGGPVTLTLTGSVGGVFGEGGEAQGGETMSFDAIAFCRALSGRGALAGVDADLVLF